MLSVNMYNNMESFENMMHQVNDISKVMMDFMDKHPEGVNMICFSQGNTISFEYALNIELRLCFTRLYWKRGQPEQSRIQPVT